MGGANHEYSPLMKDAQDENDGRERGKAGGQQPFPIHIQCHPTDLYLLALS